MKFYLGAFTLLAVALNGAALATPSLYVRRQASASSTQPDTAICAGSGATLLSSSSLEVSGLPSALKIATFACTGASSNSGTPSVRDVHRRDEQTNTTASVTTATVATSSVDLSSSESVIQTTSGSSSSTLSTLSTATQSVSNTSLTSGTSVGASSQGNMTSGTALPSSGVNSTTVADATVTITSVTVSVSETTATQTQTFTVTATETETDVETTTVSIGGTNTATVTVTSTVSASAPSVSASDVCGDICTTLCGELGPLPPTTDDCQQLANAITILNGEIPPEFTVQPNHVQTISFGTCQYWFENDSPEALSYCWLSLAQVASAAASQCLPPSQPVMSEGLCVPRSGLWQVGVAHS